MTDYIRLLLEEQEDGESRQREEQAWRPEGEGFALPLPVVEGESALPGGQENAEAFRDWERTGEAQAHTPPVPGGKALSAQEEAPRKGTEGSAAEEERDRETVPDPLWQLWTARWLEADSGETSARAAPDGPEEMDRSASGGPEENGTEADGREAEWRELGERPISLQTVNPGGGTVGATAAEWTYQALRASLSQLPAPPRETRVVTLQKPAGNTDSGGLDPEGLDRLLRRDARRFDGGFQLL